MSVHQLQRSNSPPESPSSLTGRSSTGSETSSSPLETIISTAREPCDIVLYESYLHKIPPLKKSLLMKWSKRWFVLRRTDMADPAGIELVYYKDSTKREKKQVIDLNNIIRIRPTPKIGSADNIFAIETKEKKYVLKAEDTHVKNTWLAKLCEYCGQELVYHVTVPFQTAVTVYNEAILKLSSESCVSIVLPSTSETLLTIQHADIRRMGYSEMYNRDVIWFETCKRSQADRFFFFIVPSGIEVAKQIVQELKVTIQTCTNSLLILEDSSSTDVSYIAKEHYGCPEYSVESRGHILHTGLYRFSSPTHRFYPSIPSPCDRMRSESASGINPPPSDPIVGGVSLEEFGRRKNNKAVKAPIARRPTLDKFVRKGSSQFEKQSSISSFDRQTSVSSFDRSILGTPSVDRDMTSPSFHDLSDGHFSSGSAGEVFESPIATPLGHIQRKLSVKSSNSSQGSSNGSISHSPAILEEEGAAVAADPFCFDTSSVSSAVTSATGGGGGRVMMAAQGRSFSLSGIGGSGPTVPPRSVVSLQQDATGASFPGKLATAH